MLLLLRRSACDVERRTRFVDDLFVRGFERRCRCRGGEELSDLGEEEDKEALSRRNIVRDFGKDECDYDLVHTAINAILPRRPDANLWDQWAPL